MDSNMAFYFYSDLSPNMALFQQGFGENPQDTSLCIRLLDTLTQCIVTYSERSSSLPSFLLPASSPKPTYFLPWSQPFSSVARNTVGACVALVCVTENRY